MEVTIDLTQDDYADFHRYWFLKKGLKNRIYLVTGLLLVIPFIVGIGHPFSFMFYLKELILALLILTPLYAIGIMIMLRRIKGLPAENSALLGKKKFSITEEGLMIESQSNRNVQKWKDIKAVETNQRSVFIFVGKKAAYVIPRRSFKDETEQLSFIRAMEEKMKKAG